TFQGIHITFGYVMKNIHKKLTAVLCFLLVYKSNSFTIKKPLASDRSPAGKQGVAFPMQKYIKILGFLHRRNKKIKASYRF
ncbi:MAG: hypothetical protein K2H71_07410, partial [Muribaculaceae bacterium]|nr:hypothetical protein [Muribaculaceae bacterium]